MLDKSGLEGLISVELPEAAVDPSIRNPSSHGLFFGDRLREKGLQWILSNWYFLNGILSLNGILLAAHRSGHCAVFQLIFR